MCLCLQCTHSQAALSLARYRFDLLTFFLLLPWHWLTLNCRTIDCLSKWASEWVRRDRQCADKGLKAAWRRSSLPRIATFMKVQSAWPSQAAQSREISRVNQCTRGRGHELPTFCLQVSFPRHSSSESLSSMPPLPHFWPCQPDFFPFGSSYNFFYITT